MNRSTIFGIGAGLITETALQAIGDASHVEGSRYKTFGITTHTESNDNQAICTASYTEG